jgi:hypothetical protein
MGIGVAVERTFDTALISQAVLSCLNDVLEDNTPKDAINASVNEQTQCWACVSDIESGVILGLIQFKPYNRSMLEIHPFVPPKNRKHSELIVSSAIKWAAGYAPSMYKTLITNVPTCKRYAMLFALKMGFSEVGRYKNGFKNNGTYHDMVLYQRGIDNE